MEDREFFSGENVYVSLTRFIVSGQTYAMSGITSVRAAQINPSRLGPILMGFIGLLCLFAGGNAIAVGGILVLGAFGIWHLQAPEYMVVLSSASGEVRALKSHDRAYISDVVQALNDCIVARG
jgi:hypothetical protein